MTGQIVIQQDGVSSNGALVAATDPKEQFLSLCRKARSLNKGTQKLVGLVARNILQLGQTLYLAKVAYEAMTGTGHGRRRKVSGVRSFDEEITKRTGISRAHVLRYCQVGKLSAEAAGIVEGKKLAGNLTGLLRLAQAEGIATLPELTQAVDAFESDGRQGMDTVLDRVAPKVREPKAIPVAARGEAALDAVAPWTKAKDCAPRGELPPNTPSGTTAENGAAVVVATSSTSIEPLPSAPQTVEIPILNGTGADTFMGVKIWVQIVPAKKRKGGVAVRISNAALGSSTKETGMTPS